MRTVETGKMALAVLIATVVLTLVAASYIELASAHHRDGHIRGCDEHDTCGDDVDPDDNAPDPGEPDPGDLID